MTPEELVEDSESIGGLEPVGEPEPVKKSLAYTLTFPAQEHKLGAGQDVIDPATRKSAGEIIELDREARTARAQARADRSTTCRCRAALIPGRPYDTDDQEDALDAASAARCSPATTAIRRSSRSCAASRSTATCRRPTSTR